jgi:hypothetical protein
MANSSVTIQSGSVDAPTFSRYQVEKIEAGDLNWSNLERAQRIAETAVDHFSSMAYVGEKIQKITFRTEDANSRGSLTLVG